ncbi:LamG domain-containing protein, partial [bacterium]|nr:LamG domain-containing protein [bacterium]
DRPFARHLIYHNKVTDSLLSANDWGGIETWQGGPFYLYNNISGNPNGYWNWAYQPKGKENSGRLGCAYYLDGSSKNYLFNNVAWGNNNDLSSPLCNHGAFTEATPTIENAYFNNTIHKFAVGSYFSPAGGRHLYLGNLWMDISSWVFNHGQLKEDVNSPTPPAYPHFSIAYGRNVFYDIATNRLAVFEASGTPHAGLDAFKQALAKAGSLCADAGVMATSSPVRNAAARDFIPSPGSPAIDYGAKVFVPWALYATVGEWHFRRNNADPSILIDNHWNMTPYRADRGADHMVPTCPLTAVNVSKDDYAPGTLENWTDGALRFNGKDQYAVARHAEMTKPYHYSTTIAGEFTRLTAEGSQLSTPDIDAHNFLIELYFRTAPGRTASVLVAKAADAGYRLALNNAGGITLMLTAGRRHSLLVSNLPVNDGGWHHVIAETDRAKGMMTLYVDGRAVADERIALAAGASLSNTGDLYVARGPEGHYFEGEIDFLRIARGTLADAHTTIGELYDWEFAGPFLRDFAGRPAAGKCRDAGAFEAPLQ